MKQYLTAEDISRYHYIATKYGYEVAREMMEEDGIGTTSIVLAKDAVPALELALVLYNPQDKGRFGKNGEASERVIGKVRNGVKWFHWNEFFARKSGRADLGTRTEIKTGAGDWLWSIRYSTFDRIIAEYRNKTTRILWTTEYFRIDCEWHELFDYLEAYNDKGLSTWFKSAVGYNPMTNKTVVRMQEFKTSKKKIAYLQNCPWNE